MRGTPLESGWQRAVALVRRPRKLRWQIALSMAGTVLFLWGFIMIGLRVETSNRLENEADSLGRDIRSELREQVELYRRNIVEDRQEQAGAILSYNLSGMSLGLTNPEGLEGGMALAIIDAETGAELAHSQLAYGYGHEDGIDVGRRWHLELDSGLDDAGQLALARWIVANRTHSWSFDVYPPGDENYPEDGTVALVTGFDEGGCSLRVQRIELVRPDGGVETVVETAARGENPVTVELAFMRLSSVLLPDWGSNGDGQVDMERRLANFREAQAILAREQAGERRAVLNEGGRFSGGTYGNGYGYQMARSCSFRLAAMYQLRWTYLSTLMLAALVLLILSGYTSRKLSRPLERLSQDAADGSFPCTEEGPIQEVNSLAAAFNAAQGKLEADLRREQDLTRAVAHELKTPLAVLRSHAEALLEDIDPAKREHYLAVIMEESDRMDALVRELLDLSRLEAGAETLRPEDVDLEELVRRIFARLERPLAEKGCRLSLDLAAVRVRGDCEKLERAVANYASNALRHCSPGGEVRVKLTGPGGWARIAVENDGENIPAAELPRLFETFYRGDSARSRDSGGAGLGLAIVRGMANLHGGRCGAENLPGGVRFWMEVPAAY